MESTFTLFRFRGIPIGVNWSWLFIFVLVTWSLAAGVMPQTYPGLSREAYIAMGIAASLLLFTSIVLHELGHTFQAVKEGMEIDGITLWLLGGVARFKGMFPSAGAEFRIAIAGPAVTVVLALFFGFLNWAGNVFVWPDQFVGVVDYLARINLLVLGFNLLPALPLDGGRVLRAWLWGRHGSFSVATVSAARAGRVFGGSLIAIGLLGFITGLAVGGLWFAVIGWFIMQAAQAEQSFALVRKALHGLRVRELMTPDPHHVAPDMSIQAFLDNVAGPRGHSTYPVLDPWGERLAGLVSLRLAGGIPPNERATSFVRDVMLPPEEVPVLDPEEEAIDALEKLQRGPGRAVVLADGRIAGILSISDVARTIEVEQLRGQEPQPPGARRTGVFVWVLVVAMVLTAVGFIYHPPLAVLEPGEAIDITADISIDGHETAEVDGRYLLTSVRVNQPNAIGLIFAAVRDQDIVPVQAIIPPGVDPDEFVAEQRELFRQSRMMAAAAAAESAGLDVAVTGTGARVLRAIDGTPADGLLEADDVIVAVDGDPVELNSDLQEAIRARPAGTEFTLTVERGGREIEIEVTSERIDGGEGAAGVGVFIETRELGVDLPFEVSFVEREIGGPSAGLAYALAVYDMISEEDIAAGRTIAATGQIDVEGNVDRVGGIEPKSIAARDEGAEIFLVPVGEVDAARGAGITVRGVNTLLEAVRTLQTGA